MTCDQAQTLITRLPVEASVGHFLEAGRVNQFLTPAKNFRGFFSDFGIEHSKL